MDRRRFLFITGASMTLPWSRLLRAAEDTPAATASVAHALERARSVGKPLLVLVIPEADEMWERQQVFGAWLNHGGDAALADLALCEVVCARLADLPTEVAPRPRSERSPLMLLVESEGEPRTRVLDPALPPLPEEFWNGGEEAAIEQRNRVIADLLHQALLGNDLRDRRAEQSRRALTETDQVALRDVADLASLAALPVEQIDRGAAYLLALGQRAEPSEHDAVRAVLARAARVRLVEQPPAGAKWATSTGCGVDIEGESSSSGGTPCGMGHVPRLSRRFLYFYSEG